MDATSSLAHCFHRASQVAEAYFTSATNLELTSRQLVLLDLISQKPGCSQTYLVSHSGVDRSTVADLISRLVRLGHVERRRSPKDGRAYEVNLTTQGRATLTAGLKAVQIADGAMTKALGNQAEQLRDLLEIVAGLPVPPQLPGRRR